MMMMIMKMMMMIAEKDHLANCNDDDGAVLKLKMVMMTTLMRISIGDTRILHCMYHQHTPDHNHHHHYY